MAGVHADHQLVGPRRCAGEHEMPVPGPQIERHRAAARGEIGQLADVHLGEAASGQQTHGRILRGPLKRVAGRRMDR
jgi:hypothetical protein